MAEHAERQSSCHCDLASTAFSKCSARPIPGPVVLPGQYGHGRTHALITTVRNTDGSCASSGNRVRAACLVSGLRHSSITAALDAAGKAGMGLDKVKAHSRHAAIGTLLLYADEHDRQGTQRTLSALVARQLEPHAKARLADKAQPRHSLLMTMARGCTSISLRCLSVVTRAHAESARRRATAPSPSNLNPAFAASRCSSTNSARNSRCSNDARPQCGRRWTTCRHA
jgi:hypothetical protein